MSSKIFSAAAFLKSAKAADFIARHPSGNGLLNMAGAYDYLEAPYYVSQDHELEGRTVHPTCREILDAYVTPLLLEKAKLAGVPTPEFYITNGYFEPPVVIDPINPFMSRSRTVMKHGREESIARSMTRNFTYAICCQDIPPGGQVRRFRSVLGWSSSPRFRSISRIVWELFHIPLATVRVIVTAEAGILLSDVSQLELTKLTEQELTHLDGRIKWGI
ncbi:MAG: RimK-like ATPgrasp N-terminal domain-containing protein [Candidatus Eisenbacteria bacterium]|uniref:RimK-like ATPgrasp N-terminal domain-containing protein n=1 Tax=Eiseniibacteriota bacterium TaxID=2212470 RepID=A0A948WCR7_UNCEI|nr:RimK-like ATPgrasp N-terminal domain-containing protein [Candidatus Eisenbacteria bacterium]MBU1950496.1 RimK-like ATPgrasp N-terminal domain-containing protein [Candidatus Eisenbacteria bacterium]MBU2691163.1 RimK-like ATPgrasp N-terminal domain-containing protein [Candidatus Eisenbacteria bacterium]